MLITTLASLCNQQLSYTYYTYSQATCVRTSFFPQRVTFVPWRTKIQIQQSRQLFHCFWLIFIYTGFYYISRLCVCVCVCVLTVWATWVAPWNHLQTQSTLTPKGIKFSSVHNCVSNMRVKEEEESLQNLIPHTAHMHTLRYSRRIITSELSVCSVLALGDLGRARGTPAHLSSHRGDDTLRFPLTRAFSTVRRVSFVSNPSVLSINRWKLFHCMSHQSRRWTWKPHWGSTNTRRVWEKVSHRFY